MSLALSLFGLSDGLSAGLVFVAGLLVLPAVVIGFESWETRWRGPVPYDPDAIYDGVYRRGVADRGLILCDYVDDAKLKSVAKQKNVDPEPSRREQARTSTRERHIGIKGTKLGRRRSTDERAWFENETDPNTILRAVLAKLAEHGDLDETVAMTPYLGLDDRTLEMVRDSQGNQSIESLRARLLSGEARAALATVVNRRRFILIESQWWTQVEDGRTILRLLELAPRTEGPNPDTEPTPIPEGVDIVAAFSSAAIKDAGSNRLRHGAMIHAGVFGTAASYDAGRLDIEPIAVFARLQATPAPLP